MTGYQIWENLRRVEMLAYTGELGLIIMPRIENVLLGTNNETLGK